MQKSNPPPFPLSLVLFQSLSLQPAWLAAKQELLNWNPSLQDEAGQLAKKLQTFPPQTLHNALQDIIHSYVLDITSGVNTYLDTPLILPHLPAEIIWKEGSSSVLDYPANGVTNHTVLFVPSLINRSYIFDLKPGCSFLEYMGNQGIPCALLDWGEPSEAESGFDIGHYVTRLERAIAYMYHRTGNPVILAGYCMGGLISLASCIGGELPVAALALFATPWDFHAEDAARFVLNDQHCKQLETLITRQGILPKEIMQMVFYLLYAEHIHKKYQMLAQLSPEETQDLLPIEYWANDGMGLAAGVAKDCLIDWAFYNATMQGTWKVNGQVINPSALTCKALVAIAKHDRIASYHSSLPLAEKIPGCTLLVADTGHVGMVAGQRAKILLWEKFAAWTRGV